MFGSLRVVKQEEGRKGKKDKKDKKDKKKKKKSSKKDKKKRSGKKRSRSHSSSSSSSSASSTRRVSDTVRQKEDAELMDILLGGSTPPPASEEGPRYKDWFADRHDPAKRRRPLDEQEMFAAGLQGRFAASTLEPQGAAAQGATRAVPSRERPPPDALLEDVVDASGKFNGVFVPVHMRKERTVKDWEGLMQQMHSQHDKKQARGAKGAPKQEETGDSYSGISTLLEESRRERFGDSSALKSADVRAAMGTGCMISYGTDKYSKENVIALGDHTLLTLPVYSALTEGQCYITSIEKRHSELEMEADELTEVRNFKKCLMQMAAADGCQMVFAEVSIPAYRRQVFIDCIPVPDELFNDIELYFYKALDESENEFIQTHKRVIDTRGKPLKQCLVAGIPYIHVSFNLDGGYAHVIAEPKSFPRYLANDVCGPLLGVGLSGRVSAAQRARLIGAEARKRFRAKWDPFDWTKMLDQEEGAESEDGGGGTAADAVPTVAQGPEGPPGA
eukprot:TRINITY_DN874_c5_g1_i1.p1 TRINITY_DN874_c5_g1~~TRINITY_DN874_c5_g1_i1.p1  ORF type:complete len:503 (+),score=202.17 TRINITY_DN874_c5_g1_i1:170-1678(+)